MKSVIDKEDPDTGMTEIFPLVGAVTYGEARRAATQCLKEIKLMDKLEHLSAEEEDLAEIPRFERLACYAVPCRTGGHDIFVDAVDEVGNRCSVLYAKTFFGYFVACEIAGELARYFYHDNT